MAKGHNTWVDGKQQRSPTFNSWRGMIGRCRHPSHPRNEKYAPLGVCDRWQNGDAENTGFECFLHDMGERPGKRFTLDRKKNHLGYSKDNCRWLSLEGQGRNKTNNKMVAFGGEQMAFAEAYERCGTQLSKSSILYWMWKGHDFESALLMPSTRAKKRGKANGKSKAAPKARRVRRSPDADQPTQE